MKGFWNSLLAMLDDLEQQGVIRDGFRQQLLVANSLQEVSSAIARCHEQDLSQ